MTTQKIPASKTSNAAKQVEVKPAIETVEKSATVENVPSISVSQAYAEIMSSVFKAVTIAIRANLERHSYDGLKYGDDNGVNATISNCLTSIGFTVDSGHGAALLSVLTRSVSQLLPNVDYSLDAWNKGVFSVWSKGALLKGQLPKPITVTSTGKGKASLPYPRLDIINAMRKLADGDEALNKKVSNWSTLTDEGFLLAYTKHITDETGILFQAVQLLVDMTKAAEQAALAKASALLEDLDL